MAPTGSISSRPPASAVVQDSTPSTQVTPSASLKANTASEDLTPGEMDTVTRQTKAAEFMDKNALTGVTLPSEPLTAAGKQNIGTLGTSATTLSRLTQNRLTKTFRDPASIAEGATRSIPIATARGRTLALANVTSSLFDLLPKGHPEKEKISDLLTRSLNAVEAAKTFNESTTTLNNTPLELTPRQLNSSIFGDPPQAPSQIRVSTLLQQAHATKATMQAKLQGSRSVFKEREDTLVKAILFLADETKNKFSSQNTLQAAQHISALLDERDFLLDHKNNLCASASVRELLAIGINQPAVNWVAWSVQSKSYKDSSALMEGENISAETKAVHLICHTSPASIKVQTSGWQGLKYEEGSSLRLLVALRKNIDEPRRPVIAFLDHSHVNTRSGAITEDYGDEIDKAIARAVAYEPAPFL